jgi:CHAT domain-containing protein
VLCKGPSTRLASFAAAALILAAGALPAQQQQTANPFYKELTKPWQLYNTGKLDEAAVEFRAVLERATAAHDFQAQAWAQDALGIIFADKAAYPAARIAYNRALELYRSAGDEAGEGIVNQQLGNVSLHLGGRTLANEYYRKALEIFEKLGSKRLEASVLVALARTDGAEAAQYSGRAMAIAREINDLPLQAQLFHQAGDNFFMRGIFDAAEEQLDQAAAIFQQLGIKGGLARVFTSQGRLQRAHGHPEKSLELYERALKLQEETHDREGAIQSTNAIAVAYQNMGNPAKAITQFQLALKMARETGTERLINFELANLASAYGSVGRHQESVDILEKMLHDDPAMEWAALRYESLAIEYYRMGRYQQTIEAADHAITGMRAANQPGSLPDVLVWKARAEDRAGAHEAALKDTEQSLAAIEELRAHLVPSDFMKRGFAEAAQRIFSLSIQIMTAAHQTARAFEVAEEARSRAFLDLLAARSLETAQSELNPARTLADDPTLEESDSTSRLGTETDSSAIWRQWTSVDTELRSPVSAQPVSFAAVQSTARRLNSTVLSYWVGEDTTFVWLISPTGEVHAASSTVGIDHLRKLIGSLWPQGDAALAPDASAKEHWGELYRLLILPVEKWLPPAPGSLITIEPHGPLLMLPFAALRDAQGRYLLERFTLHYVPAISLLDFTRKEAPPARHFLLVADPAGLPNGADGKALPALPGSRREVAAIARLVPVSDVKLLEGKDASEQQVRDLSGKNSVVHFATHGIIRDDRPFDSYLALGASGAGKDRDGRLTAQEIYALRLQSDLVFLSACRSGLGKVTGDGMMGLTRAFLYAGAPSVIASLWDVADEPTYRLVPAFYRSWLQGKSKSAALRSAQLELLRALRAGQVKLHTAAGDITLPEDPVFWASFTLQGAP